MVKRNQKDEKHVARSVASFHFLSTTSMHNREKPVRRGEVSFRSRLINASRHIVYAI